MDILPKAVYMFNGIPIPEIENSTLSSFGSTKDHE
jgi:hypothetical protein